MKTASILRKAATLLNKGFRSEIAKQGHHLTGALEQSIDADIIDTKAEGTIVDYGQILDAGTAPGRIPYSAPSGRGGTSKFIQGLITFWKLRGLSEKEAERAAFATANKQKQEGMSTEASKRFSKTGQRQGFIETVVAQQTPAVDAIMSAGMDDIFNAQYTKQISETI